MRRLLLYAMKTRQIDDVIILSDPYQVSLVIYVLQIIFLYMFRLGLPPCMRQIMDGITLLILSKPTVFHLPELTVWKPKKKNGTTLSMIYSGERWECPFREIYTSNPAKRF